MADQAQVIEITDPAEKSRLCEALIWDLPDWFGQPASNHTYIAEIADKTVLAILAADGRTPMGVLALKTHYEKTADIWWLAVDQRAHRQGIGAALVTTACAHAIEQGCTRLVVETLSAASPDPFYARTRRFYTAMGFSPLLDLPFGDPQNPMMWMIMDLPQAA